MSFIKKKVVKKTKKKKSKITEDPKIVRDVVSAAERHDNKALLHILDDPIFCKHFDLGDTGMSGEALVRACAVGNIVGAHALLEHKASASIYNGKALHKACVNHQLDVIKLLMQYGADPNAVSVWANFSSLHFAAIGGNVLVLQLLVESGCFLDNKTHPYHCHNENGWTALHLACDRGHVDAVKYLVSKGAQIDVPNSNAETACALAAECGYSDIVQFLVCSGADVHAKRRGLSLLQWAVYRADIQLIKFLVSYGAVPDMDTRVSWFTEDRPPEFGQWDYEVSDEVVALAEIQARIDAQIRAEHILRERIRQQTETNAATDFDSQVSSQQYETEEQLSQARENYILDAVNTALREVDNPELATARKQSRDKAIQAVNVPKDDKRGYMTLGHVVQRDVSPTIYERILSAFYEGQHQLQARVARQAVLGQVRWTPVQTIDAASLLEDKVEPNALAGFPPQVVHIISSYE